MTQFVQLSTGM